ncbi:MAG: response regulator [Deltaproteobacteria bacterium]|nr:response regulator [Deltaproteobacteria bacterium]
MTDGQPVQQLDGKGTRVLVVDDDEPTARLIAAQLERQGFEVQIATRVEEATQIVIRSATRPQLVLLDVDMPGINGEQFCRFVKGNDMFREIKVLLCSGLEPQRLQSITRSSGADGFVCKKDLLGSAFIQQIDPAS